MEKSQADTSKFSQLANVSLCRQLSSCSHFVTFKWVLNSRFKRKYESSVSALRCRISARTAVVFSLGLVLLAAKATKVVKPVGLQQKAATVDGLKINFVRKECLNAYRLKMATTKFSGSRSRLLLPRIYVAAKSATSVATDFTIKRKLIAPIFTFRLAEWEESVLGRFWDHVERDSFWSPADSSFARAARQLERSERENIALIHF